jgi:hypothetical protein
MSEAHCACCRRAVVRGVAAVVIAGRVRGWLYYLPALKKKTTKK